LPETSFTDSDFAEWPLHDAIVGPFTLDLEAQTCRLDLDVFFRRGEDAQPGRIEWEGVSEFKASQTFPWGRSFPAINRHWREDELYVLELQTGDQVQVAATSASLSERRAV
jgi:hypothetical protein